MGLTADEKATLEALTAKANEPDAEDYEVEIFNEKGAGTRIPLSKAAKWLRENFGIGDDEASDDSAGGSGASGGEGGGAGGAAPSGGTPPRSVFGSRGK